MLFLLKRRVFSYISPRVKPLSPPKESPRFEFEDVPYARVTLDNGQDYTLKWQICHEREKGENNDADTKSGTIGD